MGRRKESIVFIDTHVVVWLYDVLLELLSSTAKKSLNENDIYISAIVKLELKYLYELKKIRTSPKSIIETLSESIGLKVSGIDFNKTINVAMNMNWTRDPFDRIITAEAQTENQHLITKDKKIRQNYPLAIW